MTAAIENYLNHIKNICPEITESEQAQFSEELTVTKLERNDFYIVAGQVQQRGGFLVKGLVRAFHT
ncbi:MAG: hypothetical protein LBE91_05100, partial [Tannerella sp.]|nr:hypothetical protein [Tannerella sp.]